MKRPLLLAALVASTGLVGAAAKAEPLQMFNIQTPGAGMINFSGTGTANFNQSLGTSNSFNVGPAPTLVSTLPRQVLRTTPQLVLQNWTWLERAGCNRPLVRPLQPLTLQRWLNPQHAPQTYRQPRKPTAVVTAKAGHQEWNEGYFGIWMGEPGVKLLPPASARALATTTRRLDDDIKPMQTWHGI